MTGHIMGIIWTAIVWMPFVGMVMHILTTIFLRADTANNNEPAKMLYKCKRRIALIKTILLLWVIMHKW